MCLYINKSRHPEYKPLIAGYNILAYKSFIKSRNALISPYRLYKWYENVESSVNDALFRIHHFAAGRYIEHGLHAYMEKLSAEYEIGNTVRRVIIPMGSKFYIGKDGDIVANRMIVLPNRYKLEVSEADFSKHKIG